MNRQCLGCGHERAPLPASAPMDSCPNCGGTGWCSPPQPAPTSAGAKAEIWNLKSTAGAVT